MIDDDRSNEQHVESYQEALSCLREHLDALGGDCSDPQCSTCSDVRLFESAGRLRLAKAEHRLKVESLRLAVRESLCIYCGDVPTDRDHLLPRPWTNDAIRRHVPTVAACRSCNGILSAFPTPVITARCEFIAVRLRRRWSKFLSHTADATGLTGNLRKQIEANNYRREVLKGRLAVLDLGGVPEIPGAWQDKLMEEGPAGLKVKGAPANPSALTTSRRGARWERSGPPATARAPLGQLGLPSASPTVTDESSNSTPGEEYLRRKAASTCGDEVPPKRHPALPRSAAELRAPEGAIFVPRSRAKPPTAEVRRRDSRSSISTDSSASATKPDPPLIGGTVKRKKRGRGLIG